MYDVTFTTNDAYGDISYEVYNTIGQKLDAGMMDNAGNEYKTRLNMGASPVGVYFVRLSNGEFTATKRFIVK